MITYEYNIYRSKNIKFIDLMLAECCFVWNHALALQRRYYKIYGEYISYSKMDKHFNKRFLRNLIHIHTRQEILQRLDASFQRFFKKLSKRPPKFKRKEDFSSFVFKQGGGYKLNGNQLLINRIKKVFKFSYSRKYEGNINLVRIKRCTAKRYKLYITTDHNLSNTYGKTHDGASVGIDFGLKTYMTLSNGETIQSPRFFRESEKKIKEVSRRLSKAKKGSNNRKKRKLELNRVYEDIRNKRRDFQYKLAHKLCRKYDNIFIEDLNIEAMKRLWGKKISDLSHASFIGILMHVASKYGVNVHKIDRWYPSSKTCECGYVNKSLTLKDRNWVCPKCGTSNERDLLAAKNILRRGICELGSWSKTEFLSASFV